MIDLAVDNSVVVIEPFSFGVDGFVGFGLVPPRRLEPVCRPWVEKSSAQLRCLPKRLAILPRLVFSASGVVAPVLLPRSIGLFLGMSFLFIPSVAL